MNTDTVPIAKFRLGNIVVAPDAREVLTSEDIAMGIRRHQAGDWGDVETDHSAENDLALQRGWRLHSVYESAKGFKFALVTEPDRSTTTVSVAGLQTSRSAAIRRLQRALIAEKQQSPTSATVGPAVTTPSAELSRTARPSTQRAVRTLQIEEIGDRWKGFKPRIRIMGKWLERAGFKPRTRVSVFCREAGVIELRAFGSIPSDVNLMSKDEIQNPS